MVSFKDIEFCGVPENLQYQSWEMQPTDLDEEEEDADLDADDEEEEEEEEPEEVSIKSVTMHAVHVASKA